ncbi:hypothetical protein [Thermohalobacter berrensis]|uniref:Uncharacterized protein n=1 Tax=Thermohalobacter berrensis TaxID=99594 RepID=A0A419T592_9FIRM|nr:hypothetical protein [Thermohalobacter berrensis]RKD32568.1 hypothetical protein BET03_10860 [Thermohalobacter berrensis]
MPYLTIRQIRHEMCMNKLKELGCKVVSVHDVMFIVQYSLDDYKIEYLYHITPDNKYYLERIRPYVVSAGVFDSEEEVVKIIEIDIKQFRNAKNSRNFESFIEVDKEISKAVRAFEDLFLYYNISSEDTKLIKKQIDNFLKLLNDVKNKSKRVFFEKDPESF